MAQLPKVAIQYLNLWTGTYGWALLPKELIKKMFITLAIGEN